MRFAVSIFLAVFLSAVLSSAQVSQGVAVLVNDPQGAVVPGARVAVLDAASSRTIAIQTSSAEGVAVFNNLQAGEYQIEVLAPGFAPLHSRAQLGASAAVARLSVAATSQTVVVSAARTPLPGESGGAQVSTLDAATLQAQQPLSASSALSDMAGAVINTAGRRGGLASLFVRGGESRYNKVIVDNVPVDEFGGTFDFGVVPMTEVERVELVRGADSTLYGSDAMTSVVQFWTRSGKTRVPELRFGAEGGTFATARGFASLAGARGRFDYNLFGEQIASNGQDVNDDYSNASQGANVGVALPGNTFLRFRVHHSNNRSGVQSFWNFNGQPLLPPDLDQHARQNNFMASADLTHTVGRWQHRLTGYEYNHRRNNVDLVMDPGRTTPLFGNFDFPFSDFANMNRAGLDYQGEFTPRSWARTTFGYDFEDENGFVGDKLALVTSHGLRRNHGLFGEQVVNWKRLSLVAGARFVHNESFGNRGVPRVAASVVALRGNDVFSGTRLRFAYAEGIKEPRLEESFGEGGFGIIPNPKLRPEQNRSVETGVEQGFAGGKYSLSAIYYHNLFRDRIDFNFNPVTFFGQYVNVNRALAHGAEVEFHARPKARLRMDAAYVYTSTQILQAPFAFDPLLSVGQPLLRRPRHSGNMVASWIGNRWGADVTSSFVGRRTDSDFLGLKPPVTHAAGYARVDSGGWFAVTPRVTAYVAIENLLNKRYEEAAGYPALKANFRAGMRFRIGGE